jgi:hypothetical protein
MNGRRDDPAEIAFGIVFALIVPLLLCGVAFLLAVSVVALVAFYFLGWALTYGLICSLDRLTDGWISHGFWALITSGLTWVVLAWLLFPGQWLTWLAVNLGWSVGRSSIVVLAGLLGLSWGLLCSLLLEERQRDKKVDETGLMRWAENDLSAEPDEWPLELDLQQEGVMVGYDF